jgi:ABC-type phosphate/phosphonate transport system substrate-binding protein
MVLAVGLTPAPAQQPNPNPAPQVVNLGINTGMFRDVSPALIQTVASPFKDTFRKATGLNSAVVLVDSYEDLAEKMQGKTLDFGVFHGFEYAWIKDKYTDILPLAISIPKGNNKIQACLVVNMASKAKAPRDLKGECVTLPEGTKAHCHLFLDRLREDLPPDTCCPIATRKNTSEEVLDEIVGGKAAAALVDGSALTAYENNKPGAGAQLKVLARSDPFPVGVIAYRKGAVPANVLAQVRAGLLDVNKAASGRAFLMLWKLDGFGDPTPKFEADLEKSLKAYPPPKNLPPMK